MKSTINEIRDIIIRAKVATDIFTCILTSDGKPLSPIDDVVNQNEFIRYSMEQNLLTAILELSKLFPHPNKNGKTNTKNNHFAFNTVLNTIKEQDLAPLNEITPIEFYLRDIEQTPRDGISGIFGEPDFTPKYSKTETIQCWRDKVIAHTDIDRRKYFMDIGVSPEFLYDLIRDATDILKLINKQFFSDDLNFDVGKEIVENLSVILENLSAFVKEEEQ